MKEKTVIILQDDTENTPRYFCPKCGKFYSLDFPPTKTIQRKVEDSKLDFSFYVCDGCGTELRQEEFPLVTRMCENCGTFFESTFRYFEKHSDCPNCEPGCKLVPFSNKNTAPHVFIDGSWDGVPVGKKIQEKNEQLKRKYAGYSHEQKSMREEITRVTQEKLKHN